MLEPVESDVVVKRMEESRVAYVEHRGPSSEIGLTFRELLDRLRDHGIRSAGPMITIHHRYPDERTAGKPWSEAAVPIFGKVPKRTAVGVRELQAGEVASMIYDGPASRYLDAYRILRKWVRSKGYVRAGPILEIYARDLTELPPGIVYVEIQVPIRTRRTAGRSKAKHRSGKAVSRRLEPVAASSVRDTARVRSSQAM